VISPLRILLLEDSPEDAELIQALLEADGFVCEVSRVQTRDEFVAGLGTDGIDVILADYKLPAFDGISALKLAVRDRPDLPFIFVSGAAGEELAIEALKMGATDYVLKHRLSRLVPSVRRAVRESNERAERKRAEETLREQANLLSLTHDAIFVRDMNGVITYWNRGAEALYGWTAEEARGQAAPELLKTKHPVPFERIKTYLLSRGHWEGELVRTRQDGTTVVVAARWSLQRDPGTAPVAILETNNDTTERKRAEEAVRRSEKQLREVIETIPAMVFSTLPDGSTEFVNQRWLDFTGLSPHGSQSGWQSTVHPDDQGEHLGKWQMALSSGDPFENEVRHKGVDGEYRWFLVRAVPMRDERGNIVKWYGTLTDIEDRKRAEEALRSSEEQWKAVFENNPTMYFMVDEAGAIVSVNPFGAEQLGYIPDELIGRPVQSLFHEADREAVSRHVALCLERLGRAMSWELRKIRRDGEVLWVRETARALLIEKRRMILIVCEDITARKRATEALREMQTELAHANRVATLGQLTASIAHEVNQPIAAARNDASAALRFLDGSPPDLREVKDALDSVVNDIDLAGDIIDRIRAHVKKAPARKDRFDLNRAIVEVIALARGEMEKSGVLVRTPLSAGLSDVEGDRVQLQQVVLNLMLNAVDAMSLGSDGSRELSISTERSDSGGILVTVRDTGPGIDPAHLERVFEAFYTTKSSGIGMGLSICRSIVEAHGGRLWADANAPPGAAFRFTVPLARRHS
jgi:PAS domain S-box-containing protein